MNDRGTQVDHATIQRWVVKFVPILQDVIKTKRRPVRGSWRADETYIKVKGKWCYLYRAVDVEGATVDFMLSEKRDMQAAYRFFNQSIGSNGEPLKVNIDKSEASKIALEQINKDRHASGKDLIVIRTIKYLNNIVEQDHRFIKKLIRPMLGFKSFTSASITLAGIEIVRMLKKGQLKTTIGNQTLLQKFFELFEVAGTAV